MPGSAAQNGLWWPHPSIAIRYTFPTLRRAPKETAPGTDVAPTCGYLGTWRIAVDMSGRKELMKRIVERGAELAADPSAWQGEMTIATRHTVYKFRDGLCVSVQRQDTGATQNECVE